MNDLLALARRWPSGGERVRLLDCRRGVVGSVELVHHAHPAAVRSVVVQDTLRGTPTWWCRVSVDRLRWDSILESWFEVKP